MNPKLENQLLIGARLAEHPFARPLNGFVKWLYAKPVTVLLNLWLVPLFRGQVRLVPRHSSVQGRAFNAFLSDLDLSAICDPQFNQFVELEKCMMGLRKKLPFVGELEIYTNPEMEALQFWLQRFGSFYYYLRSVRKLGWLATFLANAKTPYHQYKLQRALHIEERKIKRIPEDSVSSALTEKIESQFRELKVSVPADFKGAVVFNPYLGVQVAVGDVELPQNFSGLRLALRPALILFSICPVVQCGDPLMQTAAEELRNQVAVVEVWRGLSEIECLVQVAVSRGQPTNAEWMSAWRIWANTSRQLSSGSFGLHNDSAQI